MIAARMRRAAATRYPQQMDWFSKRSEHQTNATRLSGRPSVTEISPGLLVGEFPRPDDIAWLKSEFGVTAIHNLQDDEDLALNGLRERELNESCRLSGVKFIRTQIQDGSADAMAARLADTLGALAGLIGAGERVYLHCNAGLNRAPTLAIAYLRAHGEMSLDEACAHVKARRTCGPFMTILEDYFGPRHHKPGK
jgi:protein-tyrosine phosphatase